MQLSLPQLQQNFKKVEMPATLECAGNRRAEMKAVPSPSGTHTIKGLDWDAGAIGTAVWGGVKLRDVLQAAGKALHRCARALMCTSVKAAVAAMIAEGDCWVMIVASSVQQYGVGEGEGC